MKKVFKISLCTIALGLVVLSCTEDSIIANNNQNKETVSIHKKDIDPPIE